MEPTIRENLVIFWFHWLRWDHLNGSAQAYGNSIADTLELPQSCGEPSILS